MFLMIFHPLLYWELAHKDEPEPTYEVSCKIALEKLYHYMHGYALRNVDCLPYVLKIVSYLFFIIQHKGKIDHVYVDFIGKDDLEIRLWAWQDNCSLGAACAKRVPILLMEVSLKGITFTVFEGKPATENKWWRSPRFFHPSDEDALRIIKWFSTFEKGQELPNGFV